MKVEVGGDMITINIIIIIILANVIFNGQLDLRRWML